MKDIVGEKAVVAKDKIYREIKLGRIAGPFHFLPFPTLRISPISVIPKRSSSEYRLIHNLSFPEHGLVNDFIDKECCFVKMIHKLGKCDIKSAFRLFRLSPCDFNLMGFKFENQYFFDKFLPMGAFISCSLFEKCSTALHWFVQQESNNDNILHYLDDFLFGGKAETKQCCNTLKVVQESCKIWGVPLADDKTVEPTEVLVLLGIELDTINMVMRLPQEIVSEIKEQIISCLNSHKIILRELQSLIALWNFACQVIVPGRTFSRRLIDATCKLSKPHHKTRVTVGMKEDLKVWLTFLSNYNGTIVILDKFWSSNAILELFTDSAGGTGKGFGIYFNGMWAQASTVGVNWNVG
jgi:hypothetical protein